MEDKEIVFNVICDFTSNELFKLSEDEINKKIKMEYKEMIKHIIEETKEISDVELEDKKNKKDAIDIIIEHTKEYLFAYDLPIEQRRFICMLIERYKEL